MRHLHWIRLGLSAAGIIVWLYGYQQQLDRVRWIGIGLIALSLVMRWFGPRGPRRGEPARPPE